ncbi:MAG: RnfABCDGE type electron transport complex subunit B [Deferribacterales bacterium]
MIYAVMTLSVTGFIAGLGLMYASKKFHVEKDERIAEVNGMLPGANCGGCGYPGCMALAEAIVKGKAPVNACPVCSKEETKGIASYLGLSVSSSVRRVARVRCNGGCENGIEKYNYYGPRDCHSVVMLGGGNKVCTYACVGEGSCVKSCAFGAMRMGKDKIPVITPEKCTACGACVKACPRDLITLLPEDKPIVVICRSKDKGPDVKKACKVGCIGCKMCEKKCPVGAIDVDSFLAVIDPSVCTVCGICVEVCPTHAIRDLKKTKI